MAEQLRAPIVELTPTSNTSIHVYCNTPSYPTGMIPPIPDGSIIQRSNTSDFSSSTEIYNGPDVSFDDAGLSGGNTYYYRAKFKGDGVYNSDSDWSAVVSKTLDPGTKLSTPSIDILGVSGGVITVRINNVTNGLRGELWRSTTSDFSSDVVYVVEGNLPITIGDSNLSPNTTYYYRGRALAHDDIYFTSDWGTSNASTPNVLANPTLSLTGSTGNSITFVINPVTNGLNYQLERGDDIEFSSIVIAYTGPATTVVDNGLSENTTYFYRVKALTNGSYPESGYNNPWEVRTPGSISGFGLKYQMSFSDELGKNFNINLFFKGWLGDVTQITGSETPAIISYIGDDGLKDYIRDFKADINVLTPNLSPVFYDDITGVGDQDCWIEFNDLASDFKYSGWLIADEFSRGLDETNYQISIPVVSPVSLMKYKELVYDSGSMMVGAQSISNIVNRALSLTCPIGAKYTISSALKEKDYSGADDLFKQVAVNVESYNDDNGRPPKCFDVLDKICKSFNFYCVWEDNTLKFFDIYNDGRSAKTIKIKDDHDTSGFLINNEEVVTKSRGAKEISFVYNYGRQVGLFPNGRLIDFNQSTGLFKNWSYGSLYNNNTITKTLNSSNVLKVGSGRSVSPYRARFLGELSDREYWINANTEPLFQGFSNQFGINKGDKLKLTLHYKYFDWKAKYDKETLVDNRVPYLFVHLFLVPPDNDIRKTWYVADQKDINGTKIQEDRGVNISATPSLWPVVNGTFWNADRITIAVDSTPNTQSYECEFVWPFDSGYRVWFSIFGFRWWMGKPVTIDSSDLYIDIIDAILSLRADTLGTNSTGEQIYISQSGKVSTIEEPEEKYMGNFESPYVSGSLLKLDGTLSTGFNRGDRSDTIQNWIAQSSIAQSRSQRHKIDCKVRSNDLRVSDIVEFVNGGASLLPNKYFIGRYNYDLRKCEVSITAIEVNTESRPYTVASEDFQQPTETTDMLENYKLYE